MSDRMFAKLCIALIGTLMVSGAAFARPAQAAQLRAKYASLADSLRNNPYKRPLHIESTETDSTLKGDVYGVIPYPFAAVSAALTEAASWCDILILPVTTKSCRVTRASREETTLSIHVGLKYEQLLRDAFPIEFAYRVGVNTAEYFAVGLDAEIGPLSTRDYKVLVEVIPVENGKTFLHLRYAYGFGMAGRLAMQAYLATLGASKVGFSSTAGTLTGGTRGVIERNAMRFFLSIDAYLAAASSPTAEQLERRLQVWFNSNEQYARQLHEMDREEYVAMKRREIQRQRAPQEAARPQPASAGF